MRHPRTLRVSLHESASVTLLLVGLLIALYIAKAMRPPERFFNMDTKSITQAGISNICMVSTASYEAACPVDCILSDWSDWSSCSKSCGGGTHTRTRNIKQKPLNGGAPCGPLEDTQDCNPQKCSVDCKLSDWSQWTSCSAPCDGGTNFRVRSIVTHPTDGGLACGSILEQQTCNTQACNNPFPFMVC